MKNIALFLSTLFSARTQAHIFHLQTKSYAAHKALGDFYDQIADLSDTYAEQAQGVYGIITGYTIPTQLFTEPTSYFEVLGEKLEKMEKDLPDDCDLQNTFADVLKLVHITTYKLKHLS